MNYGLLLLLLLLRLLIMHSILTRGRPETLLLFQLLVFLVMLLLLRRIWLHGKIWIHLWCCNWKLSILTATVWFTSFRPNRITAGWSPSLTGMHCHRRNYIVMVALLKLLLMLLLLVVVVAGQCHAIHLLGLVQSLLLLLPVWLDSTTFPIADLMVIILIPLRVLLLLVRPICFSITRKCFLLRLDFV